MNDQPPTLISGKNRLPSGNTSMSLLSSGAIRTSAISFLNGLSEINAKTSISDFLASKFIIPIENDLIVGRFPIPKRPLDEINAREEFFARKVDKEFTRCIFLIGRATNLIQFKQEGRLTTLWCQVESFFD